MQISRRKAFSVIAGAPALFSLHGLKARGLTLDRSDDPAGTGPIDANLQIAPGPFRGTRESLRTWQVPDWFRDAKFGIWAHWGPQSGIEYGDWYARNMYIQGHKQYEYHVKTYGHPSKVGYKDVAPLWKADKFDPDHLLGLYKKAGARYFCSMAVHHDGFDLWDSKHQPRWNSVAIGPRRDIVGTFSG